MSLGDSIFEVILEMLGMELKKEPPTKRRSAPPSRDPNPKAQKMQSASVAADLESGYGQERPAPAPKRMTREEESAARRSAVALAEFKENQLPPGQSQNAAASSRRAEQEAAVARRRSELRDDRKETVNPAAELAARLRNNPSAARDAFIFSEIFGTPVGERQNRQ